MTNSAKSQLRQAMKARLAALSSEEYEFFNARIRERFFDLSPVKNAGSIMIYYSINHEVETCSIIKELLKLGKIVSLPICTPEKNLLAGKIEDLAGLTMANFGLREPPRGAQLLEPAKLDLIVVPGVAFDEKGYRLGHGAGYYDRFLASVPEIYKLGLAYDFQVLAELPVDRFDVPVDGLLTPDRYLRQCKRQGI